jgi:hypothetical protein
MNFAIRPISKLKAIEYFLIASSMILVIVSTRSGMGISWDSTDYMAVGRNMASGIGPIDVVGLPMAVRPPGISSLICVGDWLGLMPSTTFVIINTASAGVSTYFAMLILRMSKIQKTFEVAALSVVAFSPSLLNLSSMAWSESVFIALVMASLWIALTIRSIPMHITLGILFAFMFFIRYVGPFYSFPIALFAIFAQSKQSGFIKSAFRIGSIYFVSLVPQYLWLLRNKSIDGTLTGAREGAGGSYLQPIKTMTATFGSWVVGHDPLDGNGGIYLNWNDYSASMKIAGCIFVALLVVLILFLVRSIKQRYEASVVGLGLFFVSMFYITFSVIRFVHVEIGPLDNRMMSGIYIPLMLFFGIGLDSILRNNLLKKASVLAFTAVFITISSQSILSAFKYGSNGRYWGSTVHQAQPLHQFVKTLDAKSQFMSNEPQMLFSVIEQSPIFNQYMNARVFPRSCTDRYFVWYAVSFLPDAKPTGGEIIYSDALGEVIRLADCSVSAPIFWP